MHSYLLVRMAGDVWINPVHGVDAGNMVRELLSVRTGFSDSASDVGGL